ncbi:hypothetical protein A165_25285 [Vibrio tasmaniensis ZS-17]|uniref:hypothetical protein n=1 Tax=Vibrio tasmaniensis TaxID=212663 RepID=UPI0002E7011E|nr:hypothetical protein [Vibrio tasmaniensis]OED60265.1 hypothetical protein A165_25285 [Vibrio tasmaniensis ZS-17]
MTVTYQVLNMANGGGSENLLINPRGKINQANESDGVLSAGQYFCDGWKAGAAGAEVYRDADGFRLISGSILQLVPNNLDIGRTIKGNMDSILGNPAIRINGGTDSELSDDQPYITFEVFGNNSKFTRLILSESEDFPVYQQSPDELPPCLPFFEIVRSGILDCNNQATTLHKISVPFIKKHSTPAVTRVGAAISGSEDGTYVSSILLSSMVIGKDFGDPSVYRIGGIFNVDARI